MNWPINHSSSSLKKYPFKKQTRLGLPGLSGVALSFALRATGDESDISEFYMPRRVFDAYGLLHKHSEEIYLRFHNKHNLFIKKTPGPVRISRGPFCRLGSRWLTAQKCAKFTATPPQPNEKTFDMSPLNLCSKQEKSKKKKCYHHLSNSHIFLFFYRSQHSFMDMYGGEK